MVLPALRLLAERGARVAILGDDADVLSGAAAQACSDSLDIIPIPADVRQEKEVASAVSAVVEHCGAIRILINNAAIQPYGTVDTTPPSIWDSVMSVNLRGAYLASHFVLRAYCRARRRRSAIVNIASVQGIATQNRVAAYSTSKGGLLALTRAMAVDHASDGIRVNAVCPGCIDAPMTRMSAAETAAPGGEEALLESCGPISAARSHGTHLGRSGRRLCCRVSGQRPGELLHWGGVQSGRWPLGEARGRPTGVTTWSRCNAPAQRLISERTSLDDRRRCSRRAVTTHQETLRQSPPRGANNVTARNRAKRMGRGLCDVKRFILAIKVRV